jgi:hypothetical protein
MTHVSPASDHHRRLDHIEGVARLMDSAVRLPGTRIRLGLDSVIGLIPGLGDAATLVPAAYIIGSAYRMGVPRRVLAKMAGNTALDFAIGSVPLIGDIFDVGWKANRRNAALIRGHFETLARDEKGPRNAAPDDV